MEINGHLRLDRKFWNGSLNTPVIGRFPSNKVRSTI